VKEITKDFIKATYDIFSVWIIGIFSGASYYFYQVSKWEHFAKGKFLISLLLAFWVAWLVWGFIPIELAYRDWLIWICAFSAQSILPLIVKVWPKIFNKFLK